MDPRLTEGITSQPDGLDSETFEVWDQYDDDDNDAGCTSNAVDNKGTINDSLKAIGSSDGIAALSKVVTALRDQTGSTGNTSSDNSVEKAVTHILHSIQSGLTNYKNPSSNDSSLPPSSTYGRRFSERHETAPHENRNFSNFNDDRNSMGNGRYWRGRGRSWSNRGQFRDERQSDHNDSVDGSERRTGGDNRWERGPNFRGGWRGGGRGGWTSNEYNDSYNRKRGAPTFGMNHSESKYGRFEEANDSPTVSQNHNRSVFGDYSKTDGNNRRDRDFNRPGPNFQPETNDERSHSTGWRRRPNSLTDYLSLKKEHLEVKNKRSQVSKCLDNVRKHRSDLLMMHRDLRDPQVRKCSTLESDFGRQLSDIDQQIATEERWIREFISTYRNPGELTAKEPNYVFSDEGSHWCRHCNHSSVDLKEFLDHLQTEEHESNTENESIIPVPDEVKRKTEETIDGGPMHGSEFLSRAIGFYCTLCKEFVGGETTTMQHMSQKSHEDKYKDLLQRQPQYSDLLELERYVTTEKRRETIRRDKDRHRMETLVKHHTGSTLGGRIPKISSKSTQKQEESKDKLKKRANETEKERKETKRTMINSDDSEEESPAAPIKKNEKQKKEYDKREKKHSVDVYSSEAESEKKKKKAASLVSDAESERTMTTKKPHRRKSIIDTSEDDGMEIESVSPVSEVTKANLDSKRKEKSKKHEKNKHRKETTIELKKSKKVTKRTIESSDDDSSDNEIEKVKNQKIESAEETDTKITTEKNANIVTDSRDEKRNKPADSPDEKSEKIRDKRMKSTDSESINEKKSDTISDTQDDKRSKTTVDVDDLDGNRSELDFEVVDEAGNDDGLMVVGEDYDEDDVNEDIKETEPVEESKEEALDRSKQEEDKDVKAEEIKEESDDSAEERKKKEDAEKQEREQKEKLKQEKREREKQRRREEKERREREEEEKRKARKAERRKERERQREEEHKKKKKPTLQETLEIFRHLSDGKSTSTSPVKPKHTLRPCCVRLDRLDLTKHPRLLKQLEEMKLPKGRQGRGRSRSNSNEKRPRKVEKKREVRKKETKEISKAVVDIDDSLSSLSDDSLDLPLSKHKQSSADKPKIMKAFTVRPKKSDNVLKIDIDVAPSKDKIEPSPDNTEENETTESKTAEVGNIWAKLSENIKNEASDNDKCHTINETPDNSPNISSIEEVQDINKSEPKSEDKGDVDDTKPKSEDKGDVDDTKPKSEDKGDVDDTKPKSEDKGKVEESKPKSEDKADDEDLKPKSEDKADDEDLKPKSEGTDKAKKSKLTSESNVGKDSNLKSEGVTVDGSDEKGEEANAQKESHQTDADVLAGREDLETEPEKVENEHEEANGPTDSAATIKDRRSSKATSVVSETPVLSIDFSSDIESVDDYVVQTREMVQDLLTKSKDLSSTDSSDHDGSGSDSSQSSDE